MAAITSPVARAHGFTMVEVLVASSILIVGLLGTFSMVDQSQRTTQANSTRTMALNLAREILEQTRSLDYADLTPGTLVTQLRTRPNLAGSVDGAGNWVVVRRGKPVTIETSVCTFDDPLDGLSPVAPQNACPSAAALPGAPVEVNPDDFRRVALTLTWKVNAKVFRTTQSAQINNPSGGTGPRIISLPDPSSGLQITTGVTVPFVLTSSTSTTVRWSMDDGISAGDANGGPTIWGFNWDIGTVGVGRWTVDGTYTASVQPFDSRGTPGERRAATVLLNRRAPLAPQNMAGGRSDAGGGVVELEWTANAERDILGYRVYRTGSTSIKARICPPATQGAEAVTTKLTCTDPDPGVQPLYTLVAVDRPTLGSPASGTREGDASTLVVAGAGLRPGAPLSLVAVNVNGQVVLTWLVGLGLAQPAFYRIYRDGVRVDRTATSLPTFTDPVALDGATRRYTVTGVSSQYNESAHSNEVTVG